MFGPRREHSSVPAAKFRSRRAQGLSRLDASSRPPEGLGLDGSEHGGILHRTGAGGANPRETGVKSPRNSICWNSAEFTPLVTLTTAAGAPFPYRDFILAVTFGAIVITLVGQGVLLPSVVRWLGLADDSAAERKREHEAEIGARWKALDVARRRLAELETEGGIPREILDALRLRHEYRAGRLPANSERNVERLTVTADLRTALIGVEREFIYCLLRDGQINDESRRRIERELDLKEASIACKKEGGVDLPL